MRGLFPYFGNDISHGQWSAQISRDDVAPRRGGLGWPQVARDYVLQISDFDFKGRKSDGRFTRENGHDCEAGLDSYVTSVVNKVILNY